MSSVRYGMRTAPAIVAFLLAFPLALHAQTSTLPSPWQADVAGAVFAEAWDRNASTEWLVGVLAGADRRVWRGLSIRGEALGLRVAQRDEDAWLGGATVGTRVRWGRGLMPVVDVAVGLSEATRPLPPGGTSFNFLAVVGAGVQRLLGRSTVTVTGRWLHASNNGREGRHRNPDIQSLGLVFGIGW